MIERIVREDPMAKPQEGEPVLFSRRNPAQSNLASCPEGDLNAWYDQIRMLDAEGYPHAFLEIHGMRLELRRVCQRSDGLHADVRIMPIGSPLRWPRKEIQRHECPRGFKARRVTARPAPLVGLQLMATSSVATAGFLSSFSPCSATAGCVRAGGGRQPQTPASGWPAMPMACWAW